MELVLPRPGSYVVAVSGGLDSVCLLDILSKQAGLSLTVAHFDHGIRTDSQQDYNFVRKLADKYQLAFTGRHARLGPAASEATARAARYGFLLAAMKQTGARAIITAHHQDDRIETLIINLIRGTGRKGLASIGESKTVLRPLLKVSRRELEVYAAGQGLTWHDDSTNFEDKYLRNYIRHRVLPRLKAADRRELVALMDRQVEINRSIDRLLANWLNPDDSRQLDRVTLTLLPYKESREVVAAWLRDNNLVNFDRKTIERLTVAAKTKHVGAKIDIYGSAKVTIEKDFLALSLPER